MASIEKTPVFYASFSIINTSFNAKGEETKIIDATIEQNYSTPIVGSAQDYITAVERFEININGIPFYDGAGESVTIDPFPTSILPLKNVIAYSLPDLIDQLNALFQSEGVALDVRFGLIKIELSPEGFVIWNLSDDLGGTFKSQYDIIMGLNAVRLQSIFGLNFDNMDDDTTKTLSSSFPRWDCGDQLSYLRITSNLPTVSDSVGQAKSNVLTDLYFGKSIGASAGLKSGDVFDARAINYSQRQKIIYNPQERRFLNMRSAIPITDIRITCEFVKQDGTSEIVPLPEGCEFTIKLGFWSLRNMSTPRDTNFNSKVIGGKRFIEF